MRIAYLSSSTIPSRSANSVHVMKMCEAFAQQGHSVTLFANTNDTIEDPFAFYDVELRFRLQPMPGRNGWMRRALFGARLRNEIVSNRPNLIYARNPKALLVSGQLGIPLVFESHSLPRTQRRHDEQARIFGFPALEQLVLISKALKNDYLRHFPALSEDKIFVAHDGATAPRELVKGPESVTDRLQVGYLGHLYPGKGMEIITELAVACPWADFHVVGGRTQELELWSRKTQSIDNLELHGFVPHSETSRLLRSYHVVLAPYKRDVRTSKGGRDIGQWMSPLKIFEYMAHGKAILASDLPVLREILEDRHTALLVSPDDIDAWVAALERLREEEPLRQRLGRAAAQAFDERHSWSRRARNILESWSPTISAVAT